MAFPDTLTNLRIYLDSKLTQFTTRVDGNSDTRVITAPPLGTATLTGSDNVNGIDSGDTRQPYLVDDNGIQLLSFPYLDNPNGRNLLYDSGAMNFGSSGDAQFIFGMKFRQKTLGSGIVMSNDGGGNNTEIRFFTGNDSKMLFNVKGSSIKLSDGVTALSNAPELIADPCSIQGPDFNYFVIRADTATNTADVIVNDYEFNNCVIDGTHESGSTLTTFGARPLGSAGLVDGDIEYIVAAQDFGTLQQLRDLNSFLKGELDVLSQRVIVDGVAKSGVKVAFFQMDAFAANNVASGAFENTIQLGTAVSDANGVATLDVSGIAGYDDTKVHFAQYADALYRVSDQKWLLPQGFSSRNIDMSAPT